MCHDVSGALLGRPGSAHWLKTDPVLPPAPGSRSRRSCGRAAASCSGRAARWTSPTCAAWLCPLLPPSSCSPTTPGFLLRASRSLFLKSASFSFSFALLDIADLRCAAVSSTAVVIVLPGNTRFPFERTENALPALLPLNLFLYMLDNTLLDANDLRGIAFAMPPPTSCSSTPPGDLSLSWTA